MVSITQGSLQVRSYMHSTFVSGTITLLQFSGRKKKQYGEFSLISNEKKNRSISCPLAAILDNGCNKRIGQGRIIWVKISIFLMGIIIKKKSLDDTPASHTPTPSWPRRFFVKFFLGALCVLHTMQPAQTKSFTIEFFMVYYCILGRWISFKLI